MSMRKFGRKSKLIALLLTFTLVFVAGCQAVANLDLNTVLKNAIKVTSSEGKQTIELKLQLAEAAFDDMTEEEAALLKMISSVKVELDNVKVQDSSHVSLNGKLTLGDATSIKFAVKASDKLAVIELEGAKQPYVLDLTGESMLALMGDVELPIEAEEVVPVVDQESLTELGKQLIDAMGTYAINGMPNPERIKVSAVNEPINGISTSLMHVQVDMNGPELWTWVKKYVDALVADRAGLDKLVVGVMDILEKNPDFWVAMGEANPFEESGEDALTKEEMTAELADGISGSLVELQDWLKLLEKEDKETLDQIFKKDLTIKADVYVDSKLDIRKQDYELNYTVSDENALDLFPFEGISFKMNSENWNVNGAVKAEEAVAPTSAFAIEQMYDMEGYQVLKQFDEKSAIYDLLRNKLHITKQSVSSFSDDYYNPPIIVPGYITIIPLRDTAEQFGAVLEYDAKTKSIKVFDEATNTTIAVKVGSDKAIINGKSVKWNFPVTTINGVTYVPARAFATALGATVSWEEFYEDVKMFTIEREL